MDNMPADLAILAVACYGIVAFSAIKNEQQARLYWVIAGLLSSVYVLSVYSWGRLLLHLLLYIGGSLALKFVLAKRLQKK